jgi:CheY-like chemotaxis protein
MKSILIVSPDPEAANILRLRLELDDCRVLTAIDKEEAIAQLKNDQPCLAVIDMINCGDDEAEETSQIISALRKKKIKTAVLLPRMTENSRLFKITEPDLVVRKPYNVNTLAIQLISFINNPKMSCSSRRDWRQLS